MLIIVDGRTPKKAKEKLSRYGEVIEFSSSGITYDAISGHPDIFLCPVKNRIAVAPNLPEFYLNIFNENMVEIVRGDAPVGENYPSSAIYNAVITDEFLIHRIDITDRSIIRETEGLEKINVLQGYCRCSLLALKKNRFITSDEGIYRALSSPGLEVLFARPDNILLPGMPNGFFGGACGIHEEVVFVMGSLDFLADGESVRKFIAGSGYELVELYYGRLFDGGGIMFL